LADPLIPDWMLQIIIASVGATISGIILLLIHHARVKQELEIHRQLELFDRKQDLYRKILDQINQMMDYSYFLGQDMNWKISRKIYDELLLIGSEDVIDYFHEFHKEMSKIDKKIDEHLYNIRNAIRKDLYSKELKRKSSRVTQMGKKSQRVLEKYENELKTLQDNGYDNFEKLSKIDIKKLHDEYKIPEESLKDIKEMAMAQNSIDEEFSKYYDSKRP